MMEKVGRGDDASARASGHGCGTRCSPTWVGVKYRVMGEYTPSARGVEDGCGAKPQRILPLVYLRRARLLGLLLLLLLQPFRRDTSEMNVDRDSAYHLHQAEAAASQQ